MHRASPKQYAWQRETWGVTTDQGVVLAGPFPDEAQARSGGNVVAADLRESMRRERRYTERQITDRVGRCRSASVFGSDARPVRRVVRQNGDWS